MTPVAIAALCLLLAVAAAWDLATYRIPNLLAAAVAVAALLLALPDSPGEWLSRCASFGLVSASVLILYVLGGLGGGDVKLLAAVSLWIPFETLPTFVLALGLAGGVQALALIAARRLAPAPAAGQPPAARKRLPYALSIAAAGWTWALAAVV